MNSATPSIRTLGALSAGLLALGMLAACTPAPEPKPTSTETALFSSDEEAFKAAEETYQAYTDAVNQTSFDDAESIERVYRWLSDPARASSKEYYSAFAAEGIQREGDSNFDSFHGLSYSSGLIVANLCIDVSKVKLSNSSGESVVPVDRVDRQPTRVEFVEATTETGLAIRSNTRAEDYKC